jgi:hypothetical protein
MGLKETEARRAIDSASTHVGASLEALLGAAICAYHSARYANDSEKKRAIVV